jgi:squalene cyclase
MYYERLIKAVPFLASLRAKALAYAMDYIHAEDQQTNYVCIGPVSKAFNMLCVLVEDGGEAKDCDAFQRHATRLADYLWVAEDGMKMAGYNGSQAWDTSFAIQAVISGTDVDILALKRTSIF